MFTSKIICSLSDIHSLEHVLSPEVEELFGNAEGGSNIVDGDRSTLSKLL